MDSIEIVGRDRELQIVGSFVNGVPVGVQALVLRGEAGAGKTTLWAAGVELAAERYRVLESRPSAAEAKLSYTVLGDLLSGLADAVLPTLPEPQSQALAVALLLERPDTGGADRRAVSVAFLGALRRLSEEGPVVLAVDDAHWTDPSSAAVLSFVMRRLSTEPVALLATERGERRVGPLFDLDRALAPERLTLLSVGPLSLGALHRLLQERLGHVFPRPTLRRLHATSDGNPFFALELARALLEKGSHLGPGEWLPVPPELQDLLRERLSALPRETRSALAVVAALAQPTFAVIRSATGKDAEKLLRPAVDAEIVRIDEEQVRFTHALFAAAVSAATPPEARREAHRRLAAAVADIEERARHLALATLEADPSVASVLDEAAHHARQRGAPAAATELAKEAIRITPVDKSDDALRRKLEAAGHSFEAGDTVTARALLDDALASAPPGPSRAQARTLLARVHTWAGDAREATRLYREALAEASAGWAVHVEAARGLAMAHLRTLEDLPVGIRHAREAMRLAERRADAATLANCVSTLAAIEGVAGQPTAAELIDRALTLDDAIDEPMHPFGSFLTGISGGGGVGLVLILLDRFDDARTLCDRAYRRALETGDESSVPLLLGWLAYLDFLMGDWSSTEHSVSEAYEAAVQTGQPSQQAIAAGTKALLAAHRGDAEETRRAAEEALELASITGVFFRSAILAHWALGFLELSLGNPAGADEHLAPLVRKAEAAGMHGPGAAAFVRDEIEALISLGRAAEAGTLLQRVEARARALNHASTLATAGRCRGLLCVADGEADVAVASFESALVEHERVPIPFEHARTLFELGSTHRRAKHKRSARESLQEALELFEHLGASLWAEKARAELNRISGRAPSPTELTPTEERVASLVAEGRTNREVAAALFVSDRTVEGHLSRIYAKLGVHSRSELTRLRITSGRAAADA